MNDEDEEFNRIERESRIKQDYVRDIKKPSREALMAEVAVLTELVRVLSDKVAELEAKQEQGVPVGVGGWLTTTSQQELGEPVAWKFYLDGCNQVVLDEDSDADIRFNGVPLYTTPQQRTTEPKRQWVDLTDEEILAAPENLIACIAYVRNKLKEKNT